MIIIIVGLLLRLYALNLDMTLISVLSPDLYYMTDCLIFAQYNIF